MTILVLNRSVLLVSPKQPAADWMLKVYEGPQLSDEEAHELFFAHYPVPYLIPETSKEEIDRRGVLNLLFQEIFEHELSTVRPDKKYWPNTASYDEFQAWFSISFSHTVYDLSEKTYVRRTLR